MKTIITFGVFDMLHLGHILLFKRIKSIGAEKYGDIRLLVAVQRSETVNRYKPEAKLVYNTQERLQMVAAVKWVDEVMTYDDIDVDICNVDFDVFAKGPDQSHQGFQKAVKWCAENSKDVFIVPRTEGISSTQLREIDNLPKPVVLDTSCLQDKDYLTSIQKKLKSVFKRFIVFLNGHDIPWWTSGGTTLGAIRHRDIIPWDDDIDLLMKRSDIEMLYKYEGELNQLGLEFQYFRNYGYNHSYAKIVDKDSTVWEQEEDPFISGIWIDIFPLYNRCGGIEGSFDNQLAFIEKFNKYKKGISSYTFNTLWQAARKFRIKTLLHMLKCNLYWHPRNHYYWSRFTEFEAGLNQKEASNYISYRGVGTTMYNREWFDGFAEVWFGDFKVRVPKGWHEYLTYHYGNYMAPPQPLPKFSHTMYYLNLNERLSKEEVNNRIKRGENRVL
jgi:cytidyltransferase-like protein